MKRCILEATKENVLQSIRENTYNRLDDIKDFIMALDNIEGNMFISLDAKWGAGKTFYVRQVEQSLDYLTRKAKGLHMEEDVVVTFCNSPLSEIELNSTYLPIYYNAWMYDNHDDPLMSLILLITKEYEKYCGSKLSIGSFADKVTEFFDLISISMGGIQIGGNFRNIKEVLHGKDILSSVKTRDEIRDKVKEVFNSIIVENVQKLVIFIDELDRCRPSFAMEMLERIKHYFDDDRIIFVVSVNKEQLIHTITRYYGDGFDSTAYLNKFFDINIYLPDIKEFYQAYSDEEGANQYLLRSVAKDLSDYYKLTLRDYLIYFQRINSVPKQKANDDFDQGKLFSVFIPIIIILDIVDISEKQKFLNAESSILENLFKKVPTLNKIACKFGDKASLAEDKYNAGFNEIKKVYTFMFGDRKDVLEYKSKIKINMDFKEWCIKISNGFK